MQLSTQSSEPYACKPLQEHTLPGGRITHRDMRLIRHVALAHVLSRTQMMEYGYFGSTTRANTRLRFLRAIGLIRRIETPFFSQGLYCATSKAAEIVGERIAPLIARRGDSPRFLQHAITVSNVDLALRKRGAVSWYFEQQLTAEFTFGGATYQVRPDGMAVFPQKGSLLIEADLGHVAIPKFAAKLRALECFFTSGEANRLWGDGPFRLLTLTTTRLRAKQLLRVTPPNASYQHDCETFASTDIPTIGSWS